MTDTERDELIANAQQRLATGLHFLAGQALDEAGFAAFVNESLSWAEGADEPIPTLTRRERKMVALARDFEALAELLPPAEYGALRAALPERLALLWQAKARHAPAPLRLVEP